MKLFLLISFLVFSKTSYAQINIQRFEYIGANKTGSMVAFLLTHYGPSSNALFVNLFVYDSEKAGTIVFHDEVFDIYGDEERMRVLKEKLLEKTKDSLKSFGIINKNIIPLIGISTKYDNQILIESDLFQGVSYFNTHIQFFEEPNEECENKKNFTYKLSALIESYNQTIELPRQKSIYDCGLKTVDFSNTFKINDYIWYVLYETHEVMPDLFFREFKTYSFKLKQF